MLNKFTFVFVLIGLISIGFSAPIDTDELKEITRTMPCKGKAPGTRLKHPSNDHKYLRCVSRDSFWVETCPDNLFYNEELDLCDWSTVSLTTTAETDDVVKFRPVLFRGNKKVDIPNENEETITFRTTTPSTDDIRLRPVLIRRNKTVETSTRTPSNFFKFVDTNDKVGEDDEELFVQKPTPRPSLFKETNKRIDNVVPFRATTVPTHVFKFSPLPFSETNRKIQNVVPVATTTQSPNDIFRFSPFQFSENKNTIPVRTTTPIATTIPIESLKRIPFRFTENKKIEDTIPVRTTTPTAPLEFDDVQENNDLLNDEEEPIPVRSQQRPLDIFTEKKRVNVEIPLRTTTVRPIVDVPVRTQEDVEADIDANVEEVPVRKTVKPKDSILVTPFKFNKNIEETSDNVDNIQVRTTTRVTPTVQFRENKRVETQRFTTTVPSTVENPENVDEVEDYDESVVTTTPSSSAPVLFRGNKPVKNQFQFAATTTTVPTIVEPAHVFKFSPTQFGVNNVKPSSNIVPTHVFKFSPLTTPTESV